MRALGKTGLEERWIDVLAVQQADEPRSTKEAMQQVRQGILPHLRQEHAKMPRHTR